MVNLSGQMEGPTKVIGLMGNSMEKVFMSLAKALKSMVNGRTERELDGLEEGKEKID